MNLSLFEKIITYLFCEEYLRKFIECNYVKFFSDKKLAKFVKTLIKFYLTYNIIPSIDEYERYISNIDEYNDFVILFQKLKGRKVVENFNFLIDQLKNQYVKHNFFNVVKNVDYDNITSSDIVNVYNILSKVISDIDVNSEVKERFVWENVEERLRKVKEKNITYGVSSGYKIFDKYTGGLNKKELYLFFGRSGIGKTRLLFNIAYNLAVQKYFGIFFSLEMYIEQIERIFDSRFGNISSEDIKYAKVDVDYYKRVLEKISAEKLPLYIIEHTGKTTMNFIESKIKEFKKKFPLDFVVIDYLTLVSTGSNLQRDEEYGEIAKRLKNLAKRENLIMIVAAQANRKMIEAENVGLEHIGYSDQIAHNSDFVAYIKRGKMVDKLIDITIVKNREGLSNITMKFLVDFSKNIISDALDITKNKEE